MAIEGARTCSCAGVPIVMGSDLLARLGSLGPTRGGQSRGRDGLDVRRSLPPLVAGLVLERSGTDPGQGRPRLVTAFGRSICGPHARNGSWPDHDSRGSSPDGRRRLLDGPGDQQSLRGRRKFAVRRGRDRGRGSARGRAPGDGRAARRRSAPARSVGEQDPRARRASFVSEHGSRSGNGVPVRLSALSWEPLTPPAESALGRFSLWTARHAGDRRGVRDLGLAGCRRAPLAAHSLARRLAEQRSARRQGHRNRCQRPADRRMG